MAGLASVVGLPKPAQMDGVYSQLAEWYHKDEVELALQAEENYGIHLAEINQILDRWSQKVTIFLEDAKDTSLRQLLLQARIDYGRARYDILERLKDIEEQTNLCSNLIFWTRFAGDEEGTQQYEKNLIELLQAQGLSQDAAKSLFEQGQRLFLSGELHESVAKLQQGAILAKQTDDKALLKQCEQYLDWCSFRLDLRKGTIAS